MRQVDLGGSGIKVEEWALGTMTWGNQTPEDDARRQMDMGLDHGLTLRDCAEMYPVNPVRAETWGRSEEGLGSWPTRMGQRGERVAAQPACRRAQVIDAVHRQHPMPF